MRAEKTSFRGSMVTVHGDEAQLVVALVPCRSDNTNRAEAALGIEDNLNPIL